MWKLNKKKGFSLIEQLCAFAIFSVMSITIISLQLNNIRLRNYNKQIVTYTDVLEAIKLEILNNYSYDNIKTIYNLDKKYISNENLNISSIKGNNFSQLFNSNPDLSNTYLVMNIVDGEVLKIHLELHIKLKYKEEILYCEFNKGNYL